MKKHKSKAKGSDVGSIQLKLGLQSHSNQSGADLNRIYNEIVHMSKDNSTRIISALPVSILSIYTSKSKFIEKYLDVVDAWCWGCGRGLI